jgi:hypothetical protein
MHMTVTRQRLAKHVPERYAVNKNRRPLLDNGFWILWKLHTCPTQRIREQQW